MRRVSRRYSGEIPRPTGEAEVPISLGFTHALGMTDQRLVRLVGGPMDGREIEADADSVEVVVTMADHTQHLYRADAGGSMNATDFAYAGRTGSA